MRGSIEVGDTFTDLVAVDRGALRVIKVPSTPRSPDIGAFNALVAAGIDPAVLTGLVHGSTVATNAILERRGARTAFVTTAGFRELLLLQRPSRRNIYDLRYRKPGPAVQRLRHGTNVASPGKALPQAGLSPCPRDNALDEDWEPAPCPSPAAPVSPSQRSSAPAPPPPNPAR